MNFHSDNGLFESAITLFRIYNVTGKCSKVVHRVMNTPGPLLGVMVPVVHLVHIDPL